MIKLLISTLLLSVVFGYVIGGRLRNLATLKPLGLSALYSGLAAGLIPLFFDLGRWNEPLVLTAYLLLAVFLILNLRSSRNLRGAFVLMLFGWVLNFAAIAANGGMPLSEWAYRRAGLSETVTPHQGGFYKIVIADQQSRLRMLGDVIPIRPISQVVSVGDVVLVIGIGLLIVKGMHEPASDGLSREPREPKHPVSP
jgi:hypothetical protein